MADQPQGRLAPHQLWRQRFCRAMDTQNESAFSALLDQLLNTPQLSWAGVDPPIPCDALSFAVSRENAWGVERLVQQGHQVSVAMLESFFGAINASRVNGDGVGSKAVENLWPVLLPAIVASPDLRRWVMCYYFEHQRDGKLARGVDWESLSMQEVIGDLLEEPLLRRHSMDVTPLQYACLASDHALMETLLLSGADGHREEPRSDMPRWSLAKALDAAGASLTGKGWSTEGIQRHAWEEWGCLAQKPTLRDGAGYSQEQRTQARTWFLGMSAWGLSSRHESIRALLRAQQLSEALPAAAGRAKKPRF